MSITGRTIRLFLVDGSPNGGLTAEIMNWTGHVLSAPRASLVEVLKRAEANRTGVYFLVRSDPERLGQSVVYIGESDNVGDRLAQHNRDDSKNFWETTCIVTNKDANLTKAHVRYLEKAGVLRFTEDVAFSSPSAAAQAVMASSRNGRTDWKTEQTGHTYAAWQEAQIADIHQGDKL